MKGDAGMFDIKKALIALERPGQMETTVCIQHRTNTDWSWVMIRYPTDITDETQTKILFDFKGQKWPEIAEQVKKYLDAHPDDGFAYA